MKASDGPVDGTRSALIVANDDYQDAGLRRLRAPAADAQALASVLQDPKIGEFQVRTLLNEPAHEVTLAVEEFFADRRPDDLLLLHVSCHGVKDEDGELYFAAANTKLRRLGATAVAAEFVNRRMSRSRSRRVVLLLDCCYAGAFERGMTARAGSGMGIKEQFGGRGRAVITASSAMEYAFEGDELADSQGVQPSVFTSALVEGLQTGEADRDQDGLVGLDELYNYVYDRVRAATPNQTPGKWAFGLQGDLVIARRAHPVTTPVPLPPGLQEAIDSPIAGIRAAAVPELTRLLHSRHAGLALAARQTLERLTNDDSRMVSAAATAALGLQVQPAPPEPAPPRLELSATAVDFGRLPQHSQSPERKIRLGNAGGGVLDARAATSASWLQLRQVDDELVVAVDTTAAGERDGTVTVDSAGGSASIHVQARVDPRPSGSEEPMTISQPEAVPAAPERDRVRPQHRPDFSDASPPPVAAQRPLGVTPPGRAAALRDAIRGSRRRLPLWLVGLAVGTVGLLIAVLVLQRPSTPRVEGALAGTGPITFVASQYTAGWVEPSLAEWNQQHPDQKVSVIELPETADAQREQMVLNFQAQSDRYTILGTDVIWTAEFAKSGWLQEIPTDQFPQWSGLAKGPRTNCQFDGKTWCVPADGQVGLLYYRKDILDKEGKRPPKTWDELERMAKTIAPKYGVDGYFGQHRQYEGLTVNASEAIWAAGGEILNDNGTEVLVNSSQARKGLGYLQRGFQQGWIPRAAINYAEEDARHRFQAGKALFMRQWPYAYALMQQDSKMKGKFAIAPLPGPSAIGGSNYAISKSATNKKTALEFIKFLTTEEQQEARLSSGVLPVSKALYSDPALQEQYPYLEVLGESIETAKDRPVTPFYNKASLAIQQAIYPVQQGQRSVDDAVSELDRTLKQIISE
jgi:ABC-type glycerol-3-phosphate transport system substrate-binding protein